MTPEREKEIRNEVMSYINSGYSTDCFEADLYREVVPQLLAEIDSLSSQNDRLRVENRRASLLLDDADKIITQQSEKLIVAENALLDILKCTKNDGFCSAITPGICRQALSKIRGEK
jgi:CCR4-NOT transcriptional regulation complex NOT5 subunit